MKMTLTQHEFLCQIHHASKHDIYDNGALAKMCHKSILESCIKRGWVIRNGDYIKLTDKAYEDAKKYMCEISSW